MSTAQLLLSSTPTSTQTTLLQDSFEEQNLNQWSSTGGTWSICRTIGNSYGACPTSGSTSALFAGNLAWSDYTLQAAVSLTAIGSAREGVDLVLHARDSSHFYEVELVKETDGTQQWEMWRNNGGQWTNLARGYFAFATGKQYIIRLQAAGSLLSVSLSTDGGNSFSALGSANDSTYTSGTVGVRSWGGMQASFDNVLVTTAGAAPAPAPVPSPQPTNSTGVASYDGCPVFTPGDYYNADITNANLDPHSADYIASVTALDKANFYASTGDEQINIATSSTALYTVRQKVSYHTFPVKQPWQSGYYIEPAGDAHSIVLLKTPPACHIYELYSTTYGNNVLSAYSGANWDLSKPYVVLPGHTPSSMASGLSLFAGMVKFEEISTGVHHALNISAIAHSLCQCYAAPASATDGLSYNGPSTAYQLPYGAHLRLKANFDDSRFGPQAKAITQALKHYGAFMADTGCCNSAIYTANPSSGGSWNQSDLNSLGALTLSQFDVLPVGTVAR